MERKTKELAQRTTALLCAGVLTFSFVLSGCSLSGKKKNSDENITNSQPSTEALNYIDPDSGTSTITCPACGSANVEEVQDQDKKYDQHYVCFDCNCEWYVEDGTAYQIADDGAVVPITTKTASNSGGGTANAVRPNNNTRPSGSKTTTTTTAPSKGSKLTIKDAAELTKWLATGEWLKYIKWYIDPDGNITTDGDKGVLGFGYSTKEKCFYATGNAWQRNFGYSDLYDKTSQLIAISYDTSKIFFIYGGKEWMIQLWKGQYGLVLIGAEVGVYNRPQGSNGSTYFECADDNERLPISLTLRRNGSPLFVRSQKLSWWQTGFVPGQLGAGVMVGSTHTKTLDLTTSITFKDEDMRKAFVIGLKKCSYIYNNVDGMDGRNEAKGKRAISFTEGNGSTPGTYAVNGNTVTLSWQ